MEPPLTPDPPPRETQAWSDWELDLLERYHALHGSQYVQDLLARRGIVRSADSLRQKASRLGLSHAMRDFVPATEVRDEAGVSLSAVLLWTERRGYRRHCRTWGRLLLLPTPAAQLYLHECRVDARPPGWWGSARAAEEVGCSVPTLLAQVDHVVRGRTAFFDPVAVRAFAARGRANLAPLGYVRLLDVALSEAGRKGAALWLRRNGHVVQVFGARADRRAQYVHEDAARAFLTARGYRADVVETLVRRAVAVDVARVKF